MKSICTILLTFWASLCFSQLDFELKPFPASADSTADADAFTAHAMLRNLSDETIVIAWQRINNDIPDGWQSYICSNITCAPPDVSMGTFSLTANDSTNLDCYFVPEGNPGNATVELRLFLTSDTSQVIFATYYGSASPVNTFEPYQEKFKIFPNPATDFLILENTSTSKVEIYNSLGQFIQSQMVSKSIDVSKLSRGIYFIKVYDLNKKLLSINKFQKITP